MAVTERAEYHPLVRKENDMKFISRDEAIAMLEDMEGRTDTIIEAEEK